MLHILHDISIVKIKYYFLVLLVVECHTIIYSRKKWDEVNGK